MIVETFAIGFIMLAFLLLAAVMYSFHELNRASIVISKRKNEKGDVVEQHIDPQAIFLTSEERDEVIEAKANWLLQCNPSLPETISRINGIQEAIGVVKGFIVKTYIHVDENLAIVLATRYMTSVKMKSPQAA